MSEDLKQTVREQFGATVAEYVTSATHAKGEDLPLLPVLAGLTGAERVLDVATAVGHTAFALAPYAREVVATDMTEAMLAEARRQADARGIRNVRFQEADAEALPFTDGAFDVVTCRIAAHHFTDVPAFCRESARVLRPGGRLLVVDNVAPEDEELDRFINAVEKLRDPGHHREYRLSEWRQFVTAAGLQCDVPHEFPSVVDFDDWLRRMRVPEPTCAEIRRRFQAAPDRVKEAFRITETEFILFKAVIRGVRTL